MSDSASSPSSAARPAPPAGGEPALIFDWSPVRWRRTRLMFFLAVAAGGHVLLFYLFKVVAPPASRTAPPAHSVTLLSRDYPPAAALLERMEDEYARMAPPMPLKEPDADALHRLVKGYQPTWERHPARLRPLPPDAQGGGLPSVIPSPALLPPPLPAAEPPAVAAADSPAPSINLSGPIPRPLPVLSIQSGLEGRRIIQPPVWPAEVTQPDWPEEGPASFMISVSADGRVLSCLPLTSTSFDTEVLRRPLLAVKFSPRTDSDETVWGWVDIQW
ncbi:MAG: hypothetical protein EOP86_14090 [Verrucomicrobiaceae bacterium]|nr:MAG: hypothetical protein EOP86_14090 [Verrucomicrobiaceae bacterium]